MEGTLGEWMGAMGRQVSPTTIGGRELEGHQHRAEARHTVRPADQAEAVEARGVSQPCWFDLGTVRFLDL